MRLEVKEGYPTGNYAYVGGSPSWVEVEKLPAEDVLKLKAHKMLEDEKGNITFEFDSDKYEELYNEQQAKKLAVFKSQKIAQSKQNLKDYLESTKLISSVHGGVEKEYSITSEKQQYLSGKILTAQTAKASGIDYTPSWNASGEECTYDWTLEELQTLAFEIESLVNPLVVLQQNMELLINNATNIDELNSINISFE